MHCPLKALIKVYSSSIKKRFGLSLHGVVVFLYTTNKHCFQLAAILPHHICKEAWRGQSDYPVTSVRREHSHLQVNQGSCSQATIVL